MVQDESSRTRNGSHRFVLSIAIKDPIPLVNPVAFPPSKKVSQNKLLGSPEANLVSFHDLLALSAAFFS